MNHRLLPVASVFVWAMFAMLLPAAAAIAQNEVVITVKPQKAAVMPGDMLAIAVVFDHKEGWHIHTNTPVPPPGVPEGTLIPTVVKPEPSEFAQFRPVQWPTAKPELVDLTGSGTPSEYLVFGGRAIAFLPVEISAGAQPGAEVVIELRIGYQACDDTTCLSPEELTERVVLPVVTLEQAAAMQPSSDPDFADFDPTVFASDAGAPRAPPLVDPGGPPSKGAQPDAVESDFTGIDLGAFDLRINVDPRSGLGLVVLMLVGFVGGFLLNLTPCVLPVIPIKIMGLQQAAGNASRCFLLGLVMSLGVLMFWLAIGAAIAVLAVLGSTSELFGIWWFTLTLGLFIGIMGLGMMGLFTMQLPQAVYRVNPRHDTLPGSFLFGIMTAVLGLPCFAPFMGGATGVAIAVSPAVAMATFGAIGAGMAFPYIVLSARPQLVNKIPRTGPASELIKQVMGLLLLAFAALFIGSGLLALVSERPYLGRALHWWALGAFVVLAGVWLIFRTLQITSSPTKRAIFGGIGAVVAIAGLATAMLFTNMHRKVYEARMAAAAGMEQGHQSDLPLDQQPWVRYTPDVFDEAIAAGHVVVVNFTAEWCLNCHLLKATVLSREQVARAISSGGVVSMTADLTSRADPGWEKLNELGERGIPLLAIFGPATDRPFKSNAYTVDQVVAAIERAKGVPAGTLAAGSGSQADPSDDRPPPAAPVPQR